MEVLRILTQFSHNSLDLFCADWKLDLDSALNPDVTIDDAYDLVMKSVEPLGEEYSREIARYQTERWVDFAANEGKDSGGYAADPYRVHPYVLMSWTGRLSDVYTLIEEGGTFGASKLNSIMKEVLTEFWGDAVEIDDDAALTWMRQSHYYMGLYSYTYSAGLVISTAGYLHLKNSENGAKDWLYLLKSGGSKTPLESAMIIGADISTDKPLRDTIQFLSDTVEQIIAYSAELGE